MFWNLFSSPSDPQPVIEPGELKQIRAYAKMHTKRIVITCQPSGTTDVVVVDPGSDHVVDLNLWPKTRTSWLSGSQPRRSGFEL